jgi:flagellin-like hook-associated protein FlgL
MTANIVLGAATQQNLLALQNVNNDLDTTQEALSTGLKVSSAVQDAVTFFEAQSLTNRATDLTTRKNDIDQGISSLTAATQGIQSAIAILQQLQGIVQSAKTETDSQRASSSTQFATLTKQLNNLLNDTSYQGLNLVNSSSTNLSLQFSSASNSTLKITGQNLLISSLLTNHVAGSVLATTIAGVKFSNAVSAGKTSQFDAIYNALGSAVDAAQASAQTLGSNVSLLQTRLSFTNSYITTLSGGASKLTVADVNLESTNLVTLQTRQSLAIQSLSIATSSEQAVLKLFH